MKSNRASTRNNKLYDYFENPKYLIDIYSKQQIALGKI